MAFWPSQSAFICSRSCKSNSLKLAKDGPSATTGRAVVLDSVDGVGDVGGGEGSEDEVRESVGPGEGSEDETREGVICEDGDDGDDDDDQDGDPGMSYSSPSSSSSTIRLRSSE